MEIYLKDSFGEKTTIHLHHYLLYGVDMIKITDSETQQTIHIADDELDQFIVALNKLKSNFKTLDLYDY